MSYQKWYAICGICFVLATIVYMAAYYEIYGTLRPTNWTIDTIGPPEYLIAPEDIKKYPLLNYPLNALSFVFLVSLALGILKQIQEQKLNE